MEYSFEFLALVLFVVVLAGILWIFEKTSEAGRNIMATMDSPPVKSDEQQVAEDLAFRNKAVYEADSSKPCEGVKIVLDYPFHLGNTITESIVTGAGMEPDDFPYKFPADSIDRSSEDWSLKGKTCSSMEPFCGEGKKP